MASASLAHTTLRKGMMVVNTRYRYCCQLLRLDRSMVGAGLSLVPVQAHKPGCAELQG
jgi:hypothetical protein